ncbi:hypothetical protein D3C79_394270 [compost metagenome]
MFTGGFPPVIKMTPGHHIARYPLVVETEQGFVIHQNVAATRFMFQLFHFGAQLEVGAEEGMSRLPVAFHQRMADKQLTAQQRINSAVIDWPRSDNRQPKQCHFFIGHHRALGFRPVRFAITVFHQVLGQRFNPLRLDACGDAAPQAAGFHQFGHHRPLRRLLEQAGAGEDREPGVAGTGKLLLVGILLADVRQQPGEQRGMHAAVIGRLAVNRQPQFFHHLAQLGVDILPFAHPQVVKEIIAAQPTELAGGVLFLLLFQVVPQVNVGQEVRVFVGEAAVFLVRRLLFVHRPLSRILDRQRGGDDHHLTHAAALLRFQYHARQARIDRQLRQLAALRGELVMAIFGRFNRTQLFQQAHAVQNIALVRRFDKRECGDIPQPERRHLQDNRRQVGAQDLRIGKLWPRQEILFGVQADTDTVRHAATAALTLVGGSLRHRLDRQALDLGAETVAADACGARIDDILDARHRQRGFRHVGRQHNAAAMMRLKHPVLFAVR